MKKIIARFVLVTAAAIIFVLICYGLAQAYLAYEITRAGQMLKELEAVKLGDNEASVLPILRKYDGFRRAPEEWAKFDKADYENLVEIGPSGVYAVADRTNTCMFYRVTRAVLSSLNSRLRRAVGLRRWNVWGRIGFKNNRVIVVVGGVTVEGSNEWLDGNWILVETIPESEIERFVTSPGITWPHMNRYLLGWYRQRFFPIVDGGGEGSLAWITPSATEDEKRSAHGFMLQCLSSRSSCRTVCDLVPAAAEYANSGTWKERKEACAAPGPRNSYW
jgi:hypothetical protein